MDFLKENICLDLSYHVKDVDELLFSLDNWNKLIADEIRKEVDLRESGVMPVAVRDSKQKYNPKI